MNKYYCLMFKIDKNEVSFSKTSRYFFRDVDQSVNVEYDLFGCLKMYTYVPAKCSEQLIETIKNNLKGNLKFHLDRINKQIDEL